MPQYAPGTLLFQFLFKILTPNTRRNSTYNPRVLPRCSLWKMAADCCSYKHPRAPFIDCETMLSPTPPHHRRFTRQLSSAPRCECVCVWVSMNGWASVTEPPSLHGGIVSKHAAYRLDSDANQLLSYAAPDLWWTLGRWMLPRLSIEISGPQQREHISYALQAPVCFL